MASACCFSLLAFLCSTRVIYSITDLQHWPLLQQDHQPRTYSDIYLWCADAEMVAVWKKCILSDRDSTWDQSLWGVTLSPKGLKKFRDLCGTVTYSMWSMLCIVIVSLRHVLCFHHSQSNLLPVYSCVEFVFYVFVYLTGSDILLCTVAKKLHWSLDTPCVVHYAAVFSSICSVWLMGDQLKLVSSC